MRIAKFLHSCVLLEQNSQKLLFDPGAFSFIEGVVKPEDFRDINVIAVTHNHPDHLDVDALKVILTQNSPVILCSQQVATQLQNHGIAAEVFVSGTRQIGEFTIESLSATHAKILADELPENVAYRVNNSVVQPGDSFAPELAVWAGTEVLLLPLAAPWLTEPAAYDFARSMQPSVVIPIHDAYAKDFFLQTRYKAFADFLGREKIAFQPLGLGEFYETGN